MPYDPTFPTANTLADANAMRGQLNALKALIDSALAGAVVDDVTTLPPGTPATVTVSLVAGVLHLSFGVPAGPPGSDGAQGVPGADGNPGEVTNAALNEAIAGTARNPTGLATLDTPFADPDSESLRVTLNTLLTTLIRLPT